MELAVPGAESMARHTPLLARTKISEPVSAVHPTVTSWPLLSKEMMSPGEDRPLGRPSVATGAGTGALLGVSAMVTGGVLVGEGVRDDVPVWLKEPVPVCVEEAVPVWLEEPVPVWLEEPVPVCEEEPEPVWLEEPVAVSDEELVPVCDEDPVPVCVEEAVPV